MQLLWVAWHFPWLPYHDHLCKSWDWFSFFFLIHVSFHPPVGWDHKSIRVICHASPHTTEPSAKHKKFVVYFPYAATYIGNKLYFWLPMRTWIKVLELWSYAAMRMHQHWGHTTSFIEVSIEAGILLREIKLNSANLRLQQLWTGVTSKGRD